MTGRQDDSSRVNSSCYNLDMSGGRPTIVPPPADLAHTARGPSAKAVVEDRVDWVERQYLRGVSEAHIIREGVRKFSLSQRTMRRYVHDVKAALPDVDRSEVRADFRRRLVAIGTRALQTVIRRGDIAEARSSDRGGDGVKALGVAVQASRAEAMVQERLAKLTGADAPTQTQDVGSDINYDLLTLEEAAQLDALLTKAGAKGAE